MREFQLHLLNKRKLAVETVAGRITALRFFFVKVLHRPYQELDLIYPKLPVQLPTVLSEDEVAKLIESASNAYHRVILTTLYATGMRRTELSYVGAKPAVSSPHSLRYSRWRNFPRQDRYLDRRRHLIRCSVEPQEFQARVVE